MSYMKKELYGSIGFFMVGIVCLISSFIFYGHYEDSPVSNVGVTFSLVGLMLIVINLRIMKNPERCEEVEIMKTEERTVFIRDKANSVVYHISVFIEVGALILASILGYKNVIMFIAAIMVMKLVIWIIAAHKIGNNN